jgi:phthalate 4,5-dioxygenase oxygenase subunit
MQESMGAIADRTGERLGASDIAIVEFRRLMIKAARAFKEGKRPPGIGIKASDYPSYGSWERVVPKSTDWRHFEPYPVKQAAE